MSLVVLQGIHLSQQSVDICRSILCPIVLQLYSYNECWIQNGKCSQLLIGEINVRVKYEKSNKLWWNIVETWIDDSQVRVEVGSEHIVAGQQVRKLNESHGFFQ